MLISNLKRIILDTEEILIDLESDKKWILHKIGKERKNILIPSVLQATPELNYLWTLDPPYLVSLSLKQAN